MTVQAGVRGEVAGAGDAAGADPHHHHHHHAQAHPHHLQVGLLLVDRHLRQTGGGQPLISNLCNV